MGHKRRSREDHVELLSEFIDGLALMRLIVVQYEDNLYIWGVKKKRKRETSAGNPRTRAM